VGAELAPFAPDEEQDDGGSTSAAEAVLRRVGPELIAHDGVVGYGIGRNQIGENVIVVHLLNASAAALVPSQLDGIPVMTLVVGVVEPQ
jgi:hypothetical protein